MRPIKLVGRGHYPSSRNTTWDELPFGGLNGLYIWYDTIGLLGVGVHDADD